MASRPIPNPQSKLLAKAVVGGVGLAPDAIEPPPNMACILLYVPLDDLMGRTAPEIQDDLGLPWSANDGEPYWFADH